MATRTTTAAAAGVRVPKGETIRRGEREISILVASKEVTVTYARYAAGEQVAGSHVHHAHIDAFYVLEGELAFELGCEPITVSAGGFVAVPPGVPHAFRNASDRAASWLTIHAPDGGFAAFMRGIRDGVEVEWDISAVPSAADSRGSIAAAPNTPCHFEAAARSLSGLRSASASASNIAREACQTILGADGSYWNRPITIIRRDNASTPGRNLVIRV